MGLCFLNPFQKRRCVLFDMRIKSTPIVEMPEAEMASSARRIAKRYEVGRLKLQFWVKMERFHVMHFE